MNYELHIQKSGIDGLTSWVRDFHTTDAHIKFNLSDIDHGNNIYGKLAFP